MELIELSIDQLRDMLLEAAKNGARQAYIMADKASDLISTNNAYKMYGRAWVESLIEQGSIRPKRTSGTKTNSTRYYSRLELDTLQQSVVTKCELIRKTRKQQIQNQEVL